MRLPYACHDLSARAGASMHIQCPAELLHLHPQVVRVHHAKSCMHEIHNRQWAVPELRAALETFVTENKIVLFIKGTKQFPQCGFSNTVVQIFNQLGAPFETINVLDNELIRSGMKEYSQWPTYPQAGILIIVHCSLLSPHCPLQVWIDGELFGGCDITLGTVPCPPHHYPTVPTEAFQSGELAETVERVLAE